ncbi:MAG: nitroreductase family protein [Deltaproteobacteria bacterium]|nr:nitroreductase family protein [Deltaproteobacteria bacterium]
MRADEFLSLVRKRRSVRAYRPDPVEKKKILRCLEAARLAPSACNAQPWTFIVVDESHMKNALADLTNDSWLPLNRFARQAPVHVVVVVEKPNWTSSLGAVVKKRDFPWIDLGIAAEHFCLQATAEGLGTCMLGWFNEKGARTLLGIPQKSRVGLIITLGYAADPADQPKQRKTMEKIVRWNSYAGESFVKSEAVTGDGGRS